MPIHSLHTALHWQIATPFFVMSEPRNKEKKKKKSGEYVS